jgi:hypothetical protein
MDTVPSMDVHGRKGAIIFLDPFGIPYWMCTVSVLYELCAIPVPYEQFAVPISYEPFAVPVPYELCAVPYVCGVRAVPIAVPVGGVRRGGVRAAGRGQVAAGLVPGAPARRHATPRQRA